MTPTEVLVKARELIAIPERWIKGHHALDDNDAPVAWSDPEACQFCAEGAIRAAGAGGPAGITHDALRFFQRAVHNNDIANWNDWRWRTHDEVSPAFDRAIALSESRP